MTDRDYSVLLVEDDEVDVESVLRGMKKRNLTAQVHVRRDGDKALRALRNGEIDPERQHELIVVLDINMPGMNGHQFLEELRSDPDLRRTIVFVFSTSSHEQDRYKAYDRNVAGYFVKANVDGMLDTIMHYVRNVEFPPGTTH